MRILILCGLGTKWHNYLGLPKQLAPIQGQALLTRTLKQLNALGFEDIHLITKDPRLNHKRVPSFAPAEVRFSSEVLACTEVLWKRSQLVVLGDVYYTDAALKTIINSTAPLMFFGCPTPNLYTGTAWPELYALKFTRPAILDLKKALALTIQDAEQGGRGKLWELLMALRGYSLVRIRETLNLGSIEGAFFTTISDLTDDIDTAEDYQRLCTMLNKSESLIF